LARSFARPIDGSQYRALAECIRDDLQTPTLFDKQPLK
jgi:hypothetical protein